MKNRTIAAALALAAVMGAPLALAQSHSVTNMANPPQGGSDSKAATANTPGNGASAAKQDNAKPKQGKTAKHKAANGKTKGERMGGTRSQIKPDPDISKAQAGNETKETLQRDPSETQVSDIERRALDTSTAAKK